MLKDRMDLLTNATESIQVGVEDYQSGTRPRLLSAVRNIHAGILLLFKEALRNESPDNTNDVLMMTKIKPIRDERGIVFVGYGTKTVDVRQIQERLEGIGFVADWKRLQRITAVRNEVEHLYPKLDQKSLHGLISDSFLIIRDFLKEQLNEDPVALLGEDIWQIMLEVAEVYQKEKNACEERMAQVDWISPALKKGLEATLCIECGSDLLQPWAVRVPFSQASLECMSCGEMEEAKSFIPRAIDCASALAQISGEGTNNDGEMFCMPCPHCKKGTYVVKERRCALCGQS